MIDDLFSKANNGVWAEPATLDAPKAAGDTTADITIATGWPVAATDGPIHVKIFKTEIVDGKTVVVEGSVSDWKALLAGTTLSSMEFTGGTNQNYDAGDPVVIYPTAGYANDLYEGLMVAHDRKGNLKKAAILSALGQTETGVDWRSLGVAPTIVQINGNGSADIRFDSSNFTDRLSKGMRLLIPRTGAVQTQDTKLNGSTQFWNKVAPAGLGFVDDFAGGAWIYLTSYSASNQVIISRWNGTSGWYLTVNASGQVMLVGTNAGSGNSSLVASYQSVPLNRWVYVAAQLDMSAFTATPTTSYVMIDGVDVPAFVQRAGTNPTALVQAGNLEAGSCNGGTLPFTGEFMQSFVSSAKITQSTVRSIMNAPLSSSVISANNIVSAYSFDGNGNDLNTSTANNLSPQGAVTATNARSAFNANAYAIIMSDPVYGGVNTTMTVQYPEGYPIPSSGVGPASYSSASAPLGFPRQSKKWKITVPFKVNALLTAATSFQQVTGRQITLPIGEWEVNAKASVYFDRGATDQSWSWALSSSTTAVSNDALSAFGNITLQSGTGNMFDRMPVFVRDDVSCATQTNLYGIISAGFASGSMGESSGQTATVYEARNTLL